MAERIDILTDEISQDLGEVRAFLDEHRLRGIEVRCVGGRRAPDLTAPDRATLRAWTRAGDPQVLTVSPGLFKWPLDEVQRTRHALQETLPAAVELALELEAGALISFTFDRNLETRFPHEAPPGEAVAALSAAAEACRAAGLTLLLENEPGQIGGAAGEMAALLEALDHESAKANWDPLNGNECDEARLSVAVTRLFPWIRHVHVKNGNLAEGSLFARCGPLAAGAIDWPAHLEHLLRLGYRGWFGIETHYEPLSAGSAAAVRELRSMLAGLEGESTQ